MKLLNKNNSRRLIPSWHYNSLIVAMALSSYSISLYSIAQDFSNDESVVKLNLSQKSSQDNSQSANMIMQGVKHQENGFSQNTPPVLNDGTDRSLITSSMVKISHASASAQPLQQSQQANGTTINQPQRMSKWLIEQKQQQITDDYKLALEWQSSQEKANQAKQQQQLQQKLKQLAEKHQQIMPLVQWISQLPATGRVNLSKQDARYLEVNPQFDPILQQGDSVQQHVRQHHVTVLFDNARTCKVQHQMGIHARAYVESCLMHLQSKKTADDGYLISPDGSIEKITLSNWNAKTQTSPVPASWLWIPSQNNGWSKQLKQEVAKFLATQGVGLRALDKQNTSVIPLSSKIENQSARDLPTSSSDWGVTGLLQTPTARMPKQGTASLNIAHVKPYTQYNIRLQPFNWLETAVRYTNIDGVSYGRISPDQDYKDKSLDVKLRLLQERKWLPEIAIGWRDPAGTSLFGGEYVVANKRLGDFDFSLGMGWGYLGGRGDIDNPIEAISKRYKTRVANEIGQGGKLSPKSWFTGKSALFGGLQWHSPYQPLTLKVEYDGNDYKKDYANRNTQRIKQEQPINVGLTWQHKGLELSAGVERGDTAMFALALNGNLSELGQIKRLPKTENTQEQPKKTLIIPSTLGYQIPLSWKKNEPSSQTKLLDALSQATGWKVYKITENNGQFTVFAEDTGGVFLHERLVKAGEILSKIVPQKTRLMQIELTRQGETINRFSITPETWQAQYQQLLPTSQRLEQPFTVKAERQNQIGNTVAEKTLPWGYLSIAPTFSQSLGGPNGYLFGLYATANANYRLWKGSWLNATGQVRLADNYDKFSYTADSKLQRVRTNVRDYMTNSRVLMPNLQWTQFKQLGSNLYGLVYAGYLEPMFAGVGGEFLYRPAQGNWAIGADINQVRQRDFKQDFALQDYDVTTGHLNLYWNMPIYDVTAKLSAGQYLAGDKGATLDLSRTFKNGVKMGAWATKTNVSAEQFGEGSMDKGVYVSIPFDALFRSWSSGYTSLVYQPLIRDGGAKLGRLYHLYDLTSNNSKQALWIENPKGK